jgi:hypothetical protein
MRFHQARYDPSYAGLNEPIIGSFFQFVYCYDGERLRLGILACAPRKTKAPDERGLERPSGQTA